MTLTAILLIIVLGIIFLLLEVFVVPGVGILGFLGGGLVITAVVLAYHIDDATGNAMLAGAALMSGGLIYLTLRSDTWNRYAVKSKMSGQMNNIEALKIKIGSVGVTVSRIAPMGKASFDEHLVEVCAEDELIDEAQKVEVVRIEGNSVIIKKI